MKPLGVIYEDLQPSFHGLNDPLDCSFGDYKRMESFSHSLDFFVGMVVFCTVNCTVVRE